MTTLIAIDPGASGFSFFATGEPKAQPRPRAFARKFGATWQARVYDAGTAEGWKAQIALAAKPFVPPTPIEGPVSVSLTFYFPRPKSHFRTGKHAGELRPDAPKYHTTKPDRDNCEKAVCDALTQIGMLKDDCQVCCGPVEKRYAPCLEKSKPGCWVEIQRMENSQ